MTDPAEPDVRGRGSFGTGRSGLVVAGLVLALAIYLTIGTVTMEVPEGAESPGPTLVPGLLAVCCYIVAGLLALQLVRQPEPPEGDWDEYREEQPATFSDWRALGICIGAFLVFALALEPVGWILSAAFLFWAVVWAMGSRRGLFDVGVALVFSCAIQVAFSAGLGLNLPAGILEGLF